LENIKIFKNMLLKNSAPPLPPNKFEQVWNQQKKYLFKNYKKNYKKHYQFNIRKIIKTMINTTQQLLDNTIRKNFVDQLTKNYAMSFTLPFEYSNELNFTILPAR